MEKRGSTVIEVSVIAPMLFLITAGSLLLALFFLDLAKAKGCAIFIAVETAENKESEQAKENEEMKLNAELNRQLFFASLEEARLNLGVTKVESIVSLRTRQAWKALEEMMASTYQISNQTVSYIDRRKELLWLKEPEMGEENEKS